MNGGLTIKNTGSLPATFTLQEPGSTNTFGSAGSPAVSNLHLKITDTTASTTVYDGDFGGLPDATLTALGTLQPGDSHVYNFAVSLAPGTPNTDQNKTASATYQWVSTQLSGTTSSQ